MNRGLKSSSLHYAACFGRPNIIKLLLHFGADPELRDEDGHTPLEKAQERGDEWHRQVIEILENPGVCACGCLVLRSWSSDIPLVVGAWGSSIPLVVGAWDSNIPLIRVVGSWGSNMPCSV